MMGQGPITKKHPVLLREDSRYALKQLSSIIKDDDYEDLGNHTTKAMGRWAFSVWHRYAYLLPLSLSSNCYPFF